MTLGYSTCMVTACICERLMLLSVTRRVQSIFYLVISQLLLEQSSFLAVTRGLLHGSSDVLQSLLCLNL